MLCTVCQDLPKLGEDERTVRKTHHRTYASLQHSIEIGCYMCQRLWNSLSAEQKVLVSAFSIDEDKMEIESASGESGFSVISLEKFYPETYHLKIVVQCLSGQARYYGCSEFLQSFKGSLRAMTHGEIDDLSPSTKSASTLTLAQKWIADCTANHPRCSILEKRTRWYPTRLLDCGKSTTLEGLTTENYSQLSDEIALLSLPKLYQDAVYIVRVLGIRYLWIDSLCIIQQGDDSTDWRHEITLMSDVYLNTFCNISAADAPDSNHSIFYSRDPSLARPEILNLEVGSLCTPYHTRDSYFWKDECSNARINTRAWVLQERLLSPRLLHFGANQVLWECREKDAAEIYPNGLPRDFVSPLRPFKSIFHGSSSESLTQGSLAGYEIWITIVQAYTACKLTFPSDKVVALSAIAKVMANILDDEYVVGMWRRYLERELLWGLIDKPMASDEDIQTGSESYRSPSWSWMATNKRVRPGRVDVEPEDMLIEVEDLKLSYSMHSNAGLVPGGWLRLRGMLKTLKLLRNPDNSEPGRPANIWVMVVGGVPLAINGRRGRERQPEVAFDHFHHDFDKQNADGTLYCMPAKYKNKKIFYVLLLEAVDQERATFRRIGLGCTGASALRSHIHHIMTSYDNQPEHLCAHYLCRDGLHSVKII
ncbi:hypothetical protein GLAREA_05750 [Glarea lozoyensis ATCC 20868]|uniref:Heterokaryon incompatibility domain-containing protein n=1 Tax=Glarea lozoyensis (strain ATCC 20868 / MF5171) TaxID=1116229 RepID=S3DDC7_GLAL2|nr:uncharacterized protein GLAREA_05750 [Glarea lozoyensis ATCC 20868]EPE36412.1 hypothetical protein GLAREA_05750 [Glarea lozoyensis ATCC 20868]